MDREILFRAKRIDNGEWVYGVFWPNTSLSDLTISRIIDRDGTAHKVDHSTVGQLTGLTDKNGKKIFEGDIIAMPWNNEKVKDRMVVHYERGLFKAGSIPLCSFTGFKNPKHNCEVIGNIHDNRLEVDE